MPDNNFINIITLKSYEIVYSSCSQKHFALQLKISPTQVCLSLISD